MLSFFSVLKELDLLHSPHAQSVPGEAGSLEASQQATQWEIIATIPSANLWYSTGHSNFQEGRSMESP